MTIAARSHLNNCNFAIGRGVHKRERHAEFVIKTLLIRGGDIPTRQDRRSKILRRCLSYRSCNSSDSIGKSIASMCAENRERDLNIGHFDRRQSINRSA